MLMAFISMETFMDIPEFPMERQMAADPLYTARNGKDSAVR